MSLHPSSPSPDAGEARPEQVVGRAIQDLTAARLGRGFVPLAVLTVWGLAQVVLSPRELSGWILLAGAPATAGAMLARGLRGVQRAFGRPPSGWTTALGFTVVVPPLYGLYVVGWRGLRLLADLQWSPVVVGIVMTALGLWVLRSWLQLLEVGRLSSTMVGIGTESGASEPWDER